MRESRSLGRSFRNVRVEILLLMLIVIAMCTWSERRQLASWKVSPTVALISVDVRGNQAASNKLQGLADDRFAPIEGFLTSEGKRWGMQEDPLVRLRGMRDAIRVAPPASPSDLRDDPSSKLAVAAWSLRLRAWTWWNARKLGLPDAKVRVFVVYDTDDMNGPLDRSLGLKEGRIATLSASQGGDHGRTACPR